ncbi:MAG: cytochrome c biogenesis protein CcdA [Anaerolineae bacterium]|nr:cytochrome c biogenesis protein CcdA [Anaerolineae bacterium]MCX8068247.1 cytochrome c biogenesis protein CcdA [Anaerolineae bacterium]MDW7991706.1 cytochrome c biogenesis protein CcdA [Anaerolineae bacterium]
METPSLFLAALAGLASFLAPCVLPMVPAYIGYLSGRAVAGVDTGLSGKERFATFLHALAFVAGFTAVFVALGAAAGGVGRLLRADWVRWIGGLIMVFFGLTLMGAVKLPALYTERRLHLRAGRWGYFSSVLVGVSFAAGWTPCVGPVLGAILALGASQQTAGQAALLLTAYSLGLGIPFLLVGLAVDRLGMWLRRLHRYLHLIQVTTGAVILVFGVLLFMDWLRVLGTWLTSIGLGWDLGL